MTEEYDPFEDELEPKSKSQIKREMHELREMGEQLINLPKAQFNSLTMLSEKLILAVEEAPRIKQNNARKRHLQYIGKLMRDIDVDALQESLHQLKEKSHRSAKQKPYIENWTNELMDGDKQELESFIEQFPASNIQKLRQLIRQAKKEKTVGKASKDRQKLFVFIRDIVSEAE